MNEPATWQPYWQSAARAVKRAILGRQRVQLAGSSFTVAYETRSASHQEDVSALARLAEGRSCIFDVGANVGLTSLVMAAKMLPEGRLFAFDASEACCLIVRENSLLNDLGTKIRVVNGIVADTSGGPCEFNWDFVSGNSSIVMPSLTGRQLPLLKATLRLDDFVATTGEPPDFVKIDVEGAEFGVLRGMSRIIAESKPEIWMEVHSWPGVSLSERMTEAVNLAAVTAYDILDPQSQLEIDPDAFSRDSKMYARGYAHLRPR